MLQGKIRFQKASINSSIEKISCVVPGFQPNMASILTNASGKNPLSKGFNQLFHRKNFLCCSGIPAQHGKHINKCFREKSAFKRLQSTLPSKKFLVLFRDSSPTWQAY